MSYKATPSGEIKMNVQKSMKGHRAIITGASSGLGREFAIQLAEMGAELVLVARRVKRLQELASEIRSRCDDIQIDCIQMDLSEDGAAQRVFERATCNGKPVTVLINNAGFGVYGPFVEYDLADHRSVIQVNAVAPTELTYLAVQHLLNSGRKGYIVQVSSVAAFQSIGNFSVYSATKSYLRDFSEALTSELKGKNVHMMCLCPGGADTEFLSVAGQKLTEAGKSMMMSPDEVVRVALKQMLGQRPLFIPGLLNRILCLLPRFLPRTWSLSLANQAMQRSVQRTRSHVHFS